MWYVDRDYGNVWIPTRMDAGWAPYRDGHWAWVEPWGWTWVDDAPWGFAVSHYGRWANLGGTWGWIPGPARSRAVYAPALVAFVGGNAGIVAWFPLGPHDVYRPAYPVSRRYFTNVNTSNTVINNTNITNMYNNTNVTNVVYANRHVRGAVIAVPATAFAQSQQVSKVAMQVSKDMIMKAPVTAVAVVAPVQASVRGAALPGRKPPAGVHERSVVARNVPPAPPVSFAAKERLLATNPGRPLDAAALRIMKPAALVPTAKIRLVAPTRTGVPVTAPAVQRGKRGQPAGSGAPPQAVAPAPVASPPAPPPSPNAQRRGLEQKPEAVKHEEKRGNKENGEQLKLEFAAPAVQRGKRGQPAGSGAPPQAVAPALVASPPAPPPSPNAQRRGPEQKPEAVKHEEKRGKQKSGEQLKIEEEKQKSDEQLKLPEEEKKRKP